MQIESNGLVVTVRGDAAELAKIDGSPVVAADAFKAFPMLARVGYAVPINARWEEHDDGSATIHGVFLETERPKLGKRSANVKMKP